MERTLISWNVPNLITVPLMAFIAFLVVGVVWQLVMKASGQASDNSAASPIVGGY